MYRVVADGQACVLPSKSRIIVDFTLLSFKRTLRCGNAGVFALSTVRAVDLRQCCEDTYISDQMSHRDDKIYVLDGQGDRQ